MPTSLPPSVREQFGEAAAEDFVRWLDETLQQRTVLRDEYREVLSRLDVLEERFEQIDKRFDQQSTQFNERIDGVHDRIDRLHEAMRVQTRWTVGTIALFGTIVTVLLANAEFGA